MPASDVKVIAPMVVGFVLLIFFGLWETFSKTRFPLCPPHIFRSHKGREFTVSCSAGKSFPKDQPSLLTIISGTLRYRLHRNDDLLLHKHRLPDDGQCFLYNSNDVPRRTTGPVATGQLWSRVRRMSLDSLWRFVQAVGHCNTRGSVVLLTSSTAIRSPSQSAVSQKF